jgi:hypothetical protein
MYDKDIRFFFEENIWKKSFSGKKNRLIHEFSICKGKSIVDLAGIMEERIMGFEIKSDHDSFSRLENQIKQYDKIFDYNTIIASFKFKNVLEKKLPSHWGIILVQEKGFLLCRTAKQNPNQKMDDIYNLLWQKEKKLLPPMHSKMDIYKLLLIRNYDYRN